MFISAKLQPRLSVNACAFDLVLSVVPKQGMEIPKIPFLFIPISSKAFTAARRASVESRPPEIPMTAVFDLVCSSLLLRLLA